MISTEEAIREAVLILKNAGINDPSKDCRIFLSHLGNTNRSSYRNADHNNFTEVDYRLFLKLVERRRLGEPVSRIIQRRSFWKHDFKISPNVFDPRAETEFLVEKCLDFANNNSSICDIGTGSGCIAISVALELTEATITGIDISNRALAIAKENANRLGAKVNFQKSNWLQEVNCLFDIIISNPPYISLKDIDYLDPAVKNFDPRLALTLGDDGLGAYRYFAKEIRNYLVPGGQALFELGFDQSADVLSIFSSKGFKDIQFFKDYNGINRVVCVKKDA